jgi:hypothetical protein
LCACVCGAAAALCGARTPHARRARAAHALHIGARALHAAAPGDARGVGVGVLVW